jgi:hypothetical protein
MNRRCTKHRYRQPAQMMRSRWRKDKAGEAEILVGQHERGMMLNYATVLESSSYKNQMYGVRLFMTIVRSQHDLSTRRKRINSQSVKAVKPHIFSSSTLTKHDAGMKEVERENCKNNHSTIQNIYAEAVRHERESLLTPLHSLK